MEWEGIIGPAIYEGDISPLWKILKFGERCTSATALLLDWGNTASWS
jgi:hypothetical protein